MVKFFRTTGTLTNNTFTLLVFSGLLALATNAIASEDEPLISPFEAVYYAYKWDENLGSAKISLEELSEGLYSLTYQSKVSKFFLTDKRFEHSIFTVEDGQLLPQEYNYSRSGTGPDTSLKVIFDTSADGTIQIVEDDEKTSMDWQGEFDNQLYRLDVPIRLRQGRETLEYDFINYRGQQRHYGMEVLGKESVTLPYGTIEAYKVKIVRDSKTRVTFAWFAPDLDYQLVRLQQFKDGDEQGDLRLKAFSSSKK
ncbi:DUF3108 domain-containing protein [Alteromonas gilva]|uniref:DUF3108 domain-containing protein n=1 Tax=Alteromonas gilva TaxID=2987522 RepID=A0ABT5L412_9ALTE|nr:DUF3108 domain-containing protein [Alteromonas gilva]MDC8831174.1 DUF3108 domain-containing protein [Alteromonas gilva]